MSETEQKEEESAPTDDGTASINEDPASAPAQAQENNKIVILLKATGNAPLVKKSKWVVEQNRPMSSVISFVRKYLKLQPSESLFMYVNQSFAPAPDTILKTLYDCFSTDGKLILYYCKSQAWG